MFIIICLRLQDLISFCLFSCQFSVSETFPPQMNPKKKIFEKVQPDFQVDAKGVATYKGVPFEIQGKGICTAPTMRNSGIK